MMIDVGTHAINCTNRMRAHESEPVYFFSDSEDLVRHMAAPLQDSLVNGNASLSEQRSNVIKETISPGRIVSRDLYKKTVHLDLEDAPDVSYFYGTFVDLYLGVAARCVSFGIGNYAYLSTRISNTKCLQTHERFRPALARRWGTDLRKIKGEKCPIPMYESAM